MRTHPGRRDDLARALGLPAGRRALGIITATSDDALYAALDQGTKASPADVVYAKSFYAGAGYPSGPFSGECIGIYAARDPAEIDAALDACLAYLENEAWFYAVDDRRGSRPPGRAVSRTSSRRSAATWRRWPTSPVGSPLAYLIAPPLESIVGLDAACKAGRVRMAKWFGPPSETNFGGGYLAGDLPACEAAARAFAAAIVDVCAAPSARRSARGAGESMARRARARRPTAPPRRGSSSALGDGRALHGQARSPDPPRRRRVAGAQDAPAHRRARQARSVAVGGAGRPGRRRRRRRALAGRRAGRDPGAGARARRRRGDGQRGAAPDVCSAWAPTSIRDATHHTHELYGVPFMYPDVRQGPVVAKLVAGARHRARGGAGDAGRVSARRAAR